MQMIQHGCICNGTAATNIRTLTDQIVRYDFTTRDDMIQEQYRKARDRITIFVAVKRDDSSFDTHSLTVRQLDPRRGKNCNVSVGWHFGESSDSTGRSRFAFRSRSPARVHFSKGNVRGLIVCVSSARIERDETGRDDSESARAGSDGDGWPFPGDGNSSSIPARLCHRLSDTRGIIRHRCGGGSRWAPGGFDIMRVPRVSALH